MFTSGHLELRDLTTLMPALLKYVIVHKVFILVSTLYLFKGYRQRGAYIATQTPLPNTINDFWRMVFEYNVKCIVMLCQKQENGQASGDDIDIQPTGAF